MRRLQHVASMVRMAYAPVVVVLTPLDRDILVSDSTASQFITDTPATIEGVPFVVSPYVRQSYLVTEYQGQPTIMIL